VARSRPIRQLRLVFAIALELVCVAGFASAAEPQKQVLVLYSTRRDAQIAVVGDHELPNLLERALPEGVDYYSEFIDSGRFSHAEYQTAFRDFLQLKYQGQHFDLVVAMGEITLSFVDQYAHELFPDAAIVFFANRLPAKRPPNSTGLTADLDLRASIELATALQPDVRHVYVVLGADIVKRELDILAQEQFKSLESQLQFTYLSGLATPDLEARLGSLPPHSIVYYLVVDRDGANQNFHPIEYLDRVTAVSNAPVYCWVDSALGHGVVGGSMKDQLAQIRAVAELSLKVLHGQRADSIPVAAVDLNVSQVDWHQLRRWRISEARVPAGTLIRFREASGWDRYKFYILTALAVLLAQSLLIVGLLVQRIRRRQAEEQVRGSQTELRASYDRIRDLGARLLNAQETERARIARELHDDVSQQMALLEIDLEILGRSGEVGGESLREVLHRARDVGRSVHELSHSLHPAKLRLIGLVAGLHGLQRELSQSSAAITFTHDQVPPALSPDLTLCLFRVVQEALQNALKYGKANNIAVVLRGQPTGLILTVTDDGIGFDVNAAWGKGLGLISMWERVEAMGGTCEFHSQPGIGTRVEVVAPLRTIQGTDTVAV
jgi:signal transduction histidine kinase